MSSQIISEQRQKLSETLVDDEIDLLELWRVIWRRRWNIIGLTILVMILSALVVFSLTPIYKSASTLLIEKKAAQVVSIEQIYGLDGMGNEYLLTQFELLKSRDLAERVVKKLNLVEHPQFDMRQQKPPMIDVRGWINDFLQNYDVNKLLPFTTPDAFEMEDPELLTQDRIHDFAVKKLQSMITISPTMKTQLVSIEIENPDPKLAARIANTMASEYISSQLEAKLNVTETATAWMNERIGSLKDKLQDSERRLQAFRDQENLVEVEGGVTSVSAGELTETRTRLIDARRKRAEAESQYRQISAMDRRDWRRLATTPVILGDQLVRQFKSEEAKARSRVEELSKRYGPKHPRMQSAQSELKTATATLKSQVEQVASAVEREYQLARSNERSLQSSFEDNKEQIQDITRKEFRLGELKREVDTNRQLYDTFMTRIKETTATSDLEATNARIVDKAIVPTAPIKPRKSLIVALSAILTLMAASGISLLLHYLSNTFRSAEEIESRLNLPVLGILPFVSKAEREQLFNMFKENKNKQFAEAVRTIRTGVVLSGLDNPHKVLVVTSSVPGEGKSSTAVNMAHALSELERVLLIDADMRRPTIGKTFGFAVGTPGLANVIAGNNTAQEVIQDVDGIHVLPAGIVPPNPLELLSSKRFDEVLTELERHYDRIVIDSAPCQAVSDAVVLAQHANAVIYVVKSDATKVPMVLSGVGQLLQHNAPITGVVLNQVDVKKAQKYGYSYGGYYDYYGYSKGSA